jgi:hypothetical protein
MHPTDMILANAGRYLISLIEHVPSPAITSHTYEGDPGQLCQAEAFGETCEAAREQHEMRNCQHSDTWFDRTVCPEPCGAMHDRCTTCGETVNPCALDARTTVDNPLTSTNTVDNPRGQSHEQQ